MARHSTALTSLCNCLQGMPPVDVDWTSVIGLANQTLTTPALIDFVDKFAPILPEDVCGYIRQIHRRNVLRNNRLVAQLEEAVVAMNGLGITPIMLKGASTLATAPEERRGVRLMSDLDIMVMPDQARTAVSALCAIGYNIDHQAPPESPRWHVELNRSQDVGTIDLQQAAPGPAYLYQRFGHPLNHCVPAPLGRGRVYIPTPTYRALMLIIHDQFQDYGYWLGDLDLRHLVELRDLNNSAEGLDWRELTSLVSGELMTNAVETQLFALAELLGVEIPQEARSRLIPRLQFMRQVMQARFPATRVPLLAMMMLDLGNYRKAANGAIQPAARRRGLWSLPRVGTLQFLLKAAVAVRAGKV
ncbi:MULTISPECIES: nucleotidyltransferase family protein [unclassified Bradyrhizobium]|uniref:nucleotidyltransferase family protein n=1 Tax=unclassified Bradyrhizobium TaxID=2631580 RepID=UPI001FF37C31|nr:MULTISPECIES: nucleotidyltransferase family protein [unclassified Bradyrhizobium]MCJ9699571.1 nucleotidyltransferase family protein [Bradyrhizobium sp. SHOUNA76]MCJ9728718.1 nucleotidyltransferase family protein [Bradyrhizobium sp. PRIMUS42]